MRLFAFRCPRLHNNRPVVALPLRWRRQHPISVVEKVLATVVVEPTAEAESAPLPISVESIRLYFFKKKYEEELREGENSYPPVCSTTTVTWRPGKNINLIWFEFGLLNLLLFRFFFNFQVVSYNKKNKNRQQFLEWRPKNGFLLWWIVI